LLNFSDYKLTQFSTFDLVW